ncbi:ABC transporter ATP-binding protein [Wenxinia saemankumensis]|uniref:Carbohydrate ABC transporter ATP-binding protein, CUT1 family n=1 Tax=Wenxinia saemankumensis TaxID=1447782 RepID=A0A1M6HUV4_9RHOB|nr:sn-glycerol-3-phosphate ABC transporter ATP-binding protein UgpC [Wenxinia saemankumensis]SHJ25888.1 carbohydrate ABC transporter ATP-binding protein, CUT1 family [Wenxinia saemankumensis]
MASVTLDAVRKVYPGGTEAVTPTTLTIRDGEFLVLVGPSGCGKSTLLRMIAGLEDITEGELRIGDRIVNDVDPADRDIAMVFQNYALYPHMTVRRNIGYGLRNRGASAGEIARKVDEAAAMLNLRDYLDRKPSQLSGGQRQRIAMGRAIVRDPALFLFDEPLSNLDAKLRGQMRIEIRALQRRLGTTSIYVTHDQVEAMTMADRIVVLNGGRVEQVGTPAEIYHAPASTFVASFMGAPPMNLLTGRFESGAIRLDHGPALRAAPGGRSGPITIGIRPEDVRLGEGDHVFDVDLVEELGAHRLLHGRLGDQHFTAHVLKDMPVREGRQPIALPDAALALFDAQSGQRL